MVSDLDMNLGTGVLPTGTTILPKSEVMYLEHSHDKIVQRVADENLDDPTTS